MAVSAEIFRAYDIRGIVGETLTNDTVFSLGQAIATKVLANGEKKMLVGRDGRLSGPELSAHFIEGIISTGCDVIDIGQVATPVLYFATYHLKTPSGVMITGSHNPANYNGFKIMLSGNAIYGEEIQSIYKSIRSNEFPQGKGNVKQQSVADEYISRISNDVSIKKRLKIVVDCGNGVPGSIAPTLYEALGCEIIPLYCEVDGNFPNHHPDPSDPNNLKDLISAVAEHKADMGFAFDGDGDRLGVIDNTGKIIWADRMLMLLAQDVLSRNPNATIIYDIKSTANLAGIIKDSGGVPLMWKTGHSLIKAKIKETNALLAGEMSGHVFFKERWFGFDDALYTGARLLEILSQKNENIHDVFLKYPESSSTPEIGIDVTEENKFSIVKALVENADFKNVKNVHTLDGLRVEFADGWGLIRPSNTSPKLIARFEADNEEALSRIQQEFKDSLLIIEPGLNLPF